MSKFLRPKKPAKPSISAFDYAVYLLSLQLQSSGSIRDKLGRKKYPQADIDDAINRLTEMRYLDDGQFAQIYFENLKAYKNFGYFGMKKKMMDKKLAPELIESVLGELSRKDELALAKRVVSKNSRKTKEQLARMLASRGFRSDAVYAAIKGLPQDA